MIHPGLVRTAGMIVGVDVGIEYLVVALRLRKLAPELVDSYTGPVELADGVDSERAPTAAEVVEQARRLRARVAEVKDLEPDRRSWLAAQLAGMETAGRLLGGERIAYREVVRRCHGTSPRLVDEEQFGAAHRALAAVLPGRGEVRARYLQWLSTQVVNAASVGPALGLLADEFRERTRRTFGLPDREQVVFTFVRAKPWAAYAEYRGAGQTEIAVNLDVPMYSFWLLDLVAHEAYPGHHTEYVCKDAELVRRGRHELAVFVFPTPQALIAEGIATYACEALLGREADGLGAGMLERLGIPYDAGIAAAARTAERALLPVRANIAILLDERAISTDAAYAYARRWMLEPDELITHRIQALLADPWRPYESCYPEGLAITDRFCAGDPARFRRLLREQLTIPDLIP
jgi:hypothetical protein